MNKLKKYRKNGELYCESPVALTWDDENYYLITYKSKYNSYVHYRVDKMENITFSAEPRILPKEEFDLSAYSKKMFQMFGGDEREVSIEFSNELAGVVFDRFGTDIPVIKKSDSHFASTVKVAASKNFLSWVISFGDKAKITGPAEVVEELKELIEQVKRNY